MQNRFRSKVLWVSVVAQVVTLLVETGKIDAGMGDTINNTIAGVAQIFVVLGILNNPTDAKNP